MRRPLPFLAAALFAVLAALFTPLTANAGSVVPLAKPALSSDTTARFVVLAGYDGGHHGDYDDNDNGYDGHGDNYGHDGYGRDHDYDHHGYGHGRECDYGPRYVRKYVCDQTEPRCFRQRETIWYYGREYFRYVRKCVGGENYCKWITVPVNDCGCDDCD